MNKKLLFAAMSLAALTACTSDDFESQKVAEEVGNVQFEVINNAVTRASMGGTNNNTITWNATQNDLFTLYHGATLGDTKGYENATFKAQEGQNGGNATLTSPTMIKEGGAIMVWPVDSTFRITAAKDITIKIPADQNPTKENGSVEDYIPYVSDLVNIATHADYSTSAYNNAGYNRKYPVYMRPMASQLNLKADYNGTDDKIEELYEGKEGVEKGEGIEPIKVTSIELLTKDDKGKTKFTTEIPVIFSDPATYSINPATQWNTAGSNRAWDAVTDFNIGGITDANKTATLTTTCLNGNDGGKFLILPQEGITGGLEEAGIRVKTYYGDVVIAASGLYGTKYTDDEYNAAWYRYLPENQKITTATAEENVSASTADPVVKGSKNEDLFKTVAKNPALGLQQTINYMSTYRNKTEGSVVKGEPMGVALTRYVVVNLSHLDMSNLHIKSDKQLRDVARVWKKLGCAPVTVYLDGDDNNNFTIKQKTIEVINTVNAGGLDFKVMPCQEDGEKCQTIVITGSDYKQDVQDIAFITYNDVNNNSKFDKGTDIQAKVILADEGADKPWKWNGTVEVAANGVERIINKGTMENAEKATLKTAENDGTQNNVRLQNNGTWNITAGTLNVQFNVTNLGKVNISKGAQYRQDGATLTDFTNTAATLPKRFLADPTTEMVGVVNNEGVFATVAKGIICNYGLIEHLDKDAKTYITKNELKGDFKEKFSSTNRMGRINLKYSNKDEDNISISAAAPITEGFVSVTVTAEDLAEAGVTSKALNTATVGKFVNYMIVKSGIEEISDMPASGQIKYVEIADKDNKEIAWNVTTAQSYTGLIVLSPVNIKLGTNISATVTYLGGDKSEMYVGGTFNKASTIWNGYYGGATTDPDTKYVTF